MLNKQERIVIDTNIFIYFLISNKFMLIDSKIKSNKVKLLFSQELLEEFLEVVKRPKFRKYFSEKQIENLLSSINRIAELINVKSNVKLCRDSKDNFLLNLCIDGDADYLITGDEDLLVLKKVNKTKIITIAHYLDK